MPPMNTRDEGLERLRALIGQLEVEDLRKLSTGLTRLAGELLEDQDQIDPEEVPPQVGFLMEMARFAAGIAHDITDGLAFDLAHPEELHP